MRSAALPVWLAVMVLGTLTPGLSAQDGEWTTVWENNPKYVKEIIFHNNLDGWLIDYNNLFRTTNGGTNWMRTPLATGNNEPAMYALTFVSPQRGWLFLTTNAYDTRVFRTTDSGQSWAEVALMENTYISKAFFINNNTGWAAGGSGSVLKTTDGGLSWTQLDTGVNHADALLLDIHFRNEQFGMAAGMDGTVLRTTNGGATWEPGQNFPESTFNSVRITSDNRVFLTGESGLWVSNNGGSGFVNLMQTEHSSLQFLNENTGYVLRKNNWLNYNLYKTTDGGNSWVLHNDSPNDNRYAGFAQYFVLAENMLWKTQENFDSSLYRTSNSGASWQRLTHDRNLSFHARGNGAWVTTNLHNDVLRTQNGGSSWSYAQLPATGTLYFRDALNGWLNSNEGVYRTQDGGGSWVADADMQAWRQLFFTDATNGWSTFTENNIIFATSDGGQTWQQQYVANCEVGQIEMLPGNRGWAVCRQGGSVLKYANGNWLAVPTGTNQAFRGLITGGDNLMWVIGSNGLILRTTDGGNSWTPLSTGSTQEFSTWGGTTTGVLYIRQAGTTLISQDLGTSWQAANLPFPRTYVADFSSGVWLRYNPLENGYVSSFHGSVLKYTPAQTPGVVVLNSPANGATAAELSPFFGWDPDSAALWYHLQVSSTSDFSNLVIEDFRVPSGTYVADAILQPGTQYHWRVRAANGSSYSSWSDVFTFTTVSPDWIPQQSPVSASLNSLQFSGTKNGWAVAGGGIIISTTDGGASWQQQNSWVNVNLYSADFISQTTGWIAGANGTILKTTNSGASWSTQSTGISSSLFGVSFADGSNGWAVGMNGTILRTTNGGSSWAPQTSPSSAILTDVAFTSSTHGVAVGTGGTILHTTNGGNTWKVQSSGTSASLTSVFFQNSQTGWVTGGNGTLLKTENGGVSWSAVSTGITGNLNSVLFATDEIGWVAGQGGTIVETKDGGQTWQQVENSNGNSLNSLALAGPAVWAAGQSGMLLQHLWEPDPLIDDPEMNGALLTFTDQNNWVRELRFGFHPDAGEGYNSGLDQLAPPSPPPGIFEVHFRKGSPELFYYKDFRPYSEESTLWKLHAQPSQGSQEYLAQWNPAELEAEGTYTLRYEWYTHIPVEVDMRTTSSATIPNMTSYIEILYSPEQDETPEVGVFYTSGWNMLSMPQNIDPVTPGVLFPTHETGTLFKFDGIYQSASEIEAVRAYWLYLNQNQQVVYNQNLIQGFTYIAPKGWIMIAAPASSLNFTDIIDDGGILDPGSSYTYLPGTGYIAAPVLKPGRAYWMHTKQSGQITLIGNGSGTSPRMLPQLAGFHTLDVSNDDATPRALLMGNSGGELPEDLFTLLPPLPPAGAFDVRFSDHTWLTQELEAGLDFQAPGVEISFTYHAPAGEEMSVMQLSLFRNGQPAELIWLEHGESVQVNGTGLQQAQAVINPTVSVPGYGSELPLATELSQNYPNPFNPTTTIGYALPESSTVRLEVFNIQGQRVATLVNGTQTAGHHTVSFDASRLASGTYIYRLQTGSTSITKMMMLVK